MASATSNETITVHEISKVTRSSHSPKSANQFSLPLTFFDTYWFKLPPVQCLFFYQLTKLASTPSFFKSYIVPKLKHSLSLALFHFPPLAGNLKWPLGASKPIVSYNPNDQDGISITVAESNEYNFHILASNKISAKQLHPLVPKLISSDDKSELISFQITLFPHQGFCIGGTAQHAVIDARSASMLMRSWAYFCRQGSMVENLSLTPELTPSFDRSVVKDPDGLDMHFLNQWLAIFGEDQDSKKRNLKIPQNFEVICNGLVRATFAFSCTDIKKLREKALLRLDTTAKQLHLSSFVLTLAYITTCLVKARGGQGDRLVIVAVGVDCRTRLDPPIPITYYGNCIVYVSCSAEASNFLENNGLAFAVDMLSDLVIKVNKGSVIEDAEKDVSHFVNKLTTPEQIIVVSGSPKFNFYESDFGLGKLKKVEFVSLDQDEGVFISDSSDGSGGVEIGLALKKHEMENFATLFSNGLRKLNSKL